MWFSKIATLYRGLDRFGPAYQLNHKGSAHFKTAFGATATLCSMAVLLWLVVRLSFQVFDRTNPTSSRLTEVKSDGTKFELSQTDMIPAFMLLNKTSQQPLPAALFSNFVTMQMEVVSATVDLTTKMRTSKKIYYSIKPCGQISNKKQYKRLYEHKELLGIQDLTMNCLDIPEEESFPVFGTILDPVIQVIRFVVYPCSLTNQSQCMPDTMIQQIAIATVDYKKFVDFSDYENPIRYGYNIRDELHLMPLNGIILTRHLSQVKVQDITNSLTGEPSKTTTFLQINEEQTYVTPKANVNYCPASSLGNELLCDSYIRVEYRYSPVIDTYTRTYADIFSAFANFGGFKELIISGMFLLLYFYNNLVSHHYMQLEVLNIGSASLLADNLLISEVNSSSPVVEAQGPGTNLRPSDSNTKIFTSSESSSLKSSKTQKFKQEEAKCEYWIKKNVQELIETSTDYANLVKEINTWKILKEIFFSQYQLKLIPLAAAEIERKKRLEEKDKLVKGRTQVELLNNQIINNICTYVGQSLSYREALEKLFKEGENSEKDFANSNQIEPQSSKNELFSQVKSQIDEILKENLPEFIQGPSLKNKLFQVEQPQLISLPFAKLDLGDTVKMQPAKKLSKTAVEPKPKVVGNKRKIKQVYEKQEN